MTAYPTHRVAQPTHPGPSVPPPPVARGCVEQALNGGERCEAPMFDEPVRRRGRPTLTRSGLVLTVMLVGCGGLDPGGTLAEFEAMLLFTGLWTYFMIMDEEPLNPGPFDKQIPCRGGEGQMRIVGAFTTTSSTDTTAEGELRGVLTPEGCILFGDDEDDDPSTAQLTVDGDPSVRSDFLVSATLVDDDIFPGTVTYGGEMEGQVKWRMGARTGNCAMKVRVDYHLDFSDFPPTAALAYRGELCGYDIDYR